MKEAARLVKIKRGHTVETITKFEAIVGRMLQLAMEGDIAAARLVLFALAQNAPDPSGAAEDETVRRMVARFAHLQPKEEEAEFMSEVDETRPNVSRLRGRRRTALDQTRPVTV